MKFPLFSDNMIVNVKNPPKSTANILKLISEYSKVIGHNSLYKNMVTGFLYIRNGQLRFQTHPSILFTIVPKKMKHFGINLTKYVQIYTDLFISQC